MTRTYVSPGKIVTGDGCSAMLGQEALAMGATRAVLVTDKVLSEKTDAVRNALECLEEAGISHAVFDEAEPDPLIPTVWRCAEFVREAQADLVIGLGGGSAMDTAKGAATLLGNEAPLEEMYGAGKVPRPALPMILLPTTGGTGSEASTSCVLTQVNPDGSHTKYSIVSPFVLPRIAIVDPLLMLSCPPMLTAATGMDALTHGIESYVSKGSMALTETYALEATRLIGKYIRRAVANGQDIEARRHMANAATMAGLAFSNSMLGIVHAFAMMMGSFYHTPHGVANALMLPYVMEFNEMAATGRFAQLAVALGENIEGMSERQAAHRATVAVHQLNHDLGLPTRLSDLNISADEIPRLAEASFKNERLRGVNPRASTLQDLTQILERAV